MRNPKIDEFIVNAVNWQAELRALRAILLDCGLTEELKWRTPCYCVDGKNVAVLGVFKDYCALSFFKGALLKDPKKILDTPGENSRAGRLIRFTSPREIGKLEPVLESYIREAIEVEKAGLKIDFNKDREMAYPEELQAKLDSDTAYKQAFEALTPGRKRGYLLHFSGAKQSATRASRVEGCAEKILAGKGFHDCICGLSKKMPRCDGSHKTLR